jgi:hypothetical protein
MLDHNPGKSMADLKNALPKNPVGALFHRSRA